MNKKLIKILGIETSCDDTGVAVVSFNGENFQVLANVVASQIPIHRLTGGVVPEVAAREHVTAIVPTIEHALDKADMNLGSINAIAVTAGPGLLPALMVGVDTANSLSFSTGIPVYPIQHISGHIYANFLNPSSSLRGRSPKQSQEIAASRTPRDDISINDIRFPLLALVVSGGHTEFILMKDYLEFEKIGATVDDAGGEAFDKTAKILGLPYPGGPAISKESEDGNPEAFDFPRPMLDSNDLNFSFSGLKTSVLYQTQKMSKESLRAERSNLAASIQKAIIDTLIQKTKMALSTDFPPFTKGGLGGVKTFTLGGGVAANKLLGQRMEELFAKIKGLKYIPPKTEYATDNAAMIAAVGAMKMHLKQKSGNIIKVNPQWEL